MREEHEIECRLFIIITALDRQPQFSHNLSLLVLGVTGYVLGQHLMQGSNRTGKVITEPDLVLGLGVGSLVCSIQRAAEGFEDPQESSLSLFCFGAATNGQVANAVKSLVLALNEILQTCKNFPGLGSHAHLT